MKTKTTTRTVTLDIENMALLGWAWGLYEQNLIHIEHPQHLLTVAWKWLDEDKVHTVSLLDDNNYKKDKHNDKVVALAMAEVLEEADIVIGHNVDRFDIRMMNSMFMRHGIKPPTPYKTVDTMKIAKKYGAFTSNKLDDLGDTFGIGRKVKHEGFDMWRACDEGDARAYKKMLTYNKQDVRLTEKLYLELLPWIGNHPRLNILEERPDSCPNCLGTKFMKGSRYHTTNTNAYQYVRCFGCGHVSKVRIPVKIEKPIYV